MKYLIANFGRSRLAAGAGIGATSLQLAPTDGDRFPSPAAGEAFYVLVGSPAQSPEIRICTQRSGDVLTIEALTKDWGIGTSIINPVNAEFLEALVQRSELNNLVAWGAGADFDRLSINGSVSGPHLTGPAGATGATGATGAAGPTGPDGMDGRTILNGAGAPSNSLGANDDFYIDTSSWVIVGPKAAGAWPGSGVSLIGPTGATGATGPIGPTGPAGSGGGGSTVINLAQIDSVIGTTPKNVGSVRLVAGTYAAPSACIGCGNPAHAATLKIKEANGTVLATIGGSAGGLAWRTAGAGFTLGADIDIDLTLEADNTSAVAFVRGVRISL